MIRFQFEPGGLGELLPEVFQAVRRHLQRAHVAAVGPPFTRVASASEGRVLAEAGYPVVRPIRGSGRVVASELPGGKVARALHVGPYDQLPEVHHTLQIWIAAQGRRPAGPSWELYLTGPETSPDPASYQTEIFWPLT